MPKFSKPSNDHSIESIPYFSVIAWGIFVLFAAFVFLLTRQLHNTTVALESRAWEQAGFVVQASTTSAVPDQN